MKAYGVSDYASRQQSTFSTLSQPHPSSGGSNNYPRKHVGRMTNLEAAKRRAQQKCALNAQRTVPTFIPQQKAGSHRPLPDIYNTDDHSDHSGGKDGSNDDDIRASISLTRKVRSATHPISLAKPLVSLSGFQSGPRSCGSHEA